ncbi:MAG: thermonuclease family protein [Pseudomonadota bacterium]|nr:thermonuclease family protein [Pseudomonadota bacterium]
MARFLCLAFALLGAAPALARGPAELPAGESGTVIEVVDGDTVILSTGTEVRMVGIQAPKLPLGRRGFEPWPLSEEARATLQALVRGRTFTVHFGGQRTDRHGRALAHLLAQDGTWLQGEMLRLGMARVYSFDDNRALVAEMLELERSARAGRFGIWSHPFYRILGPDDAGTRIGTFQVVEGTIVDAALLRGTVYLNFGADWRTDFTVSIGRRAMAPFRAAGLEPETWNGRQVRVRGWLDQRNGPMIEVTHPEQIELLDDRGQDDD